MTEYRENQPLDRQAEKHQKEIKKVIFQQPPHTYTFALDKLHGEYDDKEGTYLVFTVVDEHGEEHVQGYSKNDVHYNQANNEYLLLPVGEGNELPLPREAWVRIVTELGLVHEYTRRNKDGTYTEGRQCIICGNAESANTGSKKPTETIVDTFGDRAYANEGKEYASGVTKADTALQEVNILNCDHTNSRLTNKPDFLILNS